MSACDSRFIVSFSRGCPDSRGAFSLAGGLSVVCRQTSLTCRPRRLWEEYPGPREERESEAGAAHGRLLNHASRVGFQNRRFFPHLRDGICPHRANRFTVSGCRCRTVATCRGVRVLAARAETGWEMSEASSFVMVGLSSGVYLVFPP